MAVILACMIAVAGAEPAHVLVLFSHDRLLPVNILIDEGFRKELERLEGRQLQVFTEYLDVARFSRSDEEEAMETYLRQRYMREPPMALVAVGGNAFQFFQKKRATLFPSAPVVYVAINPQNRDEMKADPQVTGIPLTLRVSPTFDAMLQMRPGLREIIAISGASNVDRMWDAAVEAERNRLATRVRVTHWAGHPMSQILAEIARLPADTAIFYFGYMRDAEGVSYVPAQVAGNIAAAASVPVFGSYETFIGRGVVGGYVVNTTEYGAFAARIVHRLRAGETPAQIGVVESPSPRFVFDARQLERWGIPRRLLPAGSELAFARLPFWKDHPRITIGVTIAVLVQAVMIIGLLLNRRQRKHAEQSLRLSEERYREVVDSQTELVCRFRPDTTLTFVNEAYGRFFGKQPRELLGKSFMALIPPEQRPEVTARLRQVMARRGPIMYEHQVLLHDGSVGWMEWQDFPVLDDRGEIQELQGIGRDITERKRAADALIEAERNLAQASRLAVVGELTASIAHEINQPLGAILSNAEAAEKLLAAGSYEQVRVILADIRKDDLRASKIIQHVRALVSKRATVSAPVQLNTVVTEVLRLVERDAQRREVVVESDLAANLPEIMGDRVQLEQVTFNLTLNALDAMQQTPAERRKLVLRTRHHQEREVELMVTDSGHGIPKERLPGIFNAFFTTKENGMGLGLALARSIAEAHHGQISAENNPDGGATFRLRLPVNGRQTD